MYRVNYYPDPDNRNKLGDVRFQIEGVYWFPIDNGLEIEASTKNRLDAVIQEIKKIDRLANIIFA